MSVVRTSKSLISTFLWIGFVCATSFMEVWLKFKAPGITIPPVLGIGGLVFDGFNKVEWVFGIVILVSGIFAKEKWLSRKNIALAIPLFLLIIRTFRTLLTLDAREELVKNEQILPPSNLHFFY